MVEGRASPKAAGRVSQMEKLVDGLEEEEEECSGAGHEQTGMICKQKSVSGDNQSTNKQLLSPTVTS